MTEKSQIVVVAAGVLLRPDGSFLLASRPAGKSYAGYWEFPGGKVKACESPYQALVRELNEELGIRVTRALPWLMRVHHYEHVSVQLCFYRVLAWQGEPTPQEAQDVVWQCTGALSVGPMLPTNGFVIQSLALPVVHAITCCRQMSTESVLAVLRANSSLQMVQIREPSLSPEALSAFTKRVASIVHKRGGIVVLNGEPAMAACLPVDGVHLTAERLHALKVRPDFSWVGASAHNMADLALAGQWELDYGLMERDVNLSHPGPSTVDYARTRSERVAVEGERAAATSWTGPERRIAGSVPLPVYVLGGMRRDDVPRVWQAQGHSIALMQGAW